MFGRTLDNLGRTLARYLARPGKRDPSWPTSGPQRDWGHYLRPGDVVLVDGTSKISAAVKFITRSVWSHAAIYVGTGGGMTIHGEPSVLVEADLNDGVIAVPLSKYARDNIRICRPVGLDRDECQRVVDFVLDRLGHQYDLRNVLDLMRYLLPEPPVPNRWRRRLLTLGSGEPTRAICSTLIAEAFHAIDYPILPFVDDDGNGGLRFRRRHHSFFTPRDFDLSPYFAIIKPTLESGFDPHQFPWEDTVIPDASQPPEASAS